MEVYMNTLAPAAGMSMSPNRNPHSGPHQLSSPEEEMQRQLDEFQRSVIIIIWYKENVQPIRLQQFVKTFPYFQLKNFPHLVEELCLTSSMYLDTFVPSSNQWEQHTIESIRVVDHQQRLIYKCRRSLLEGLSDDDCISLREELLNQSSPIGSASSTSNKPSATHHKSANESPSGHIQHSLKRPAAQHDAQDPRHSPKTHVSTAYYMAHSNTDNISSPVAGPPNDPSSTVGNAQSHNPAEESVYIYPNSVYYGDSTTEQSSPDAHNVLPHYLISPQSPPPPIPYRPHPPLKRWPNDYTVSELSSGFHAMDLLVAQSPSGASITQRVAFERVFGSRYVKSTVCRHRSVWRRASRALREQFESMGSDERACWGEFVRRVENRPPGKNSPNVDMISPTQTNTTITNMGYHDRQNSADGEEVHSQDGVMNSMQTQVSSVQNNINVYDPSRGHRGHSG